MGRGGGSRATSACKNAPLPELGAAAVAEARSGAVSDKALAAVVEKGGCGCSAGSRSSSPLHRARVRKRDAELNVEKEEQPPHQIPRALIKP